MTVRVVTDSTADLPADLVEELAVTVVPVLITFGRESYRDGVDMTTDEFFQRMAGSTGVPSTSQPPAGAFLEAYEAVADGADAIASIHLGANFSGTYATAMIARDAFQRRCPIEIVDSEGASLGLGFAVAAAARAGKRGAGLEEVVAAAKSVARRQHTLAMLDTLEYARRGGRISRIEAMLGGILNIRPILSVRTDIQAVGRARTRAVGLKRLFELSTAYPSIEQVGIMYSTTPEDAEMLAEWTRERFPGAPITISRLGPALGAHGGPGIMGMTVVEGETAA